jgi:hypothetical protein
VVLELVVLADEDVLLPLLPPPPDVELEPVAGGFESSPPHAYITRSGSATTASVIRTFRIVISFSLGRLPPKRSEKSRNVSAFGLPKGSRDARAIRGQCVAAAI